MKITDFYVDFKNAYLKMSGEVSLYIMIDDQEIEIPSEISGEDGVYKIKLADLEKIVTKEGRYSIGIKVDEEFEMLQFKQILKSRVSGRYFNTENPKKKIVHYNKR